MVAQAQPARFIGPAKQTTRPCQSLRAIEFVLDEDRSGGQELFRILEGAFTQTLDLSRKQKISMRLAGAGSRCPPRWLLQPLGEGWQTPERRCSLPRNLTHHHWAGHDDPLADFSSMKRRCALCLKTRVEYRRCQGRKSRGSTPQPRLRLGRQPAFDLFRILSVEGGLQLSQRMLDNHPKILFGKLTEQ